MDTIKFQTRTLTYSIPCIFFLDVAFSEIFCSISASTSYVLSFRMAFKEKSEHYLVTTGWIFLHQLM